MISSGTLPPLESDNRTCPSDHLIAYGTAVFQKEKAETISYVYRPFTSAGADGFVESLRNQDWSPVLGAETVDAMVKEFKSVLDLNLDAHFPLKRTTRRKSDPPWINNTLHRLWAKRRRIYDKEGRSRRWKSSELYRLRAQKYMNTQRDLLTGPDASRFFSVMSVHTVVEKNRARSTSLTFSLIWGDRR